MGVGKGAAPLPALGYPMHVRVCDACMILAQLPGGGAGLPQAPQQSSSLM
eukprot:gene19918-33559_t